MDGAIEAAPAAAQARKLPFEFTGKAGEYFGIWIVNLLLSIVTLGIYTAWAKVRRLRYFYGNTWLDGHNFEYHARPKQILIGRIIVVGFLAVYSILAKLVHPMFGLLIIPYLIAYPWLINKSMNFNARMTTYRNVRLSFGGTYWGAFGVFVAMPFAAIFSAGILAPIGSRLSTNYIGRHLKYGSARFDTHNDLDSFYGNWGVSVLFVFVAMLVTGSVGAASGTAVYFLGWDIGIPESEDVPPGVFVFTMIFFGSAYIVILLSLIFYAAGVRNLAFNTATLEGGHRFASNLGRLRYVWILVSNLIASILTLGMLRPWAAIRTWRYMANHTSLIANGELDRFVDVAAPQGSVAAAEFFDIEGIDFGL